MSNDQPLIDDDAWVRGETVELRLVLTDTEGNTFDVTALTAIELRVKKSAGDDDPPILALGLGTGITPLTQTGGDLGACTVIVTADQTFAIPAGLWHYDVVSTKSDGSRRFAIGPSLLRVNDPVNFKS